MPENVTTAVIAAAGLATRMWPASKVIPKELFPIGKVPALVHLVWEFVGADIEQVIIVTSPDGSRSIQELFDRSVLPPKKVAADPIVKRFQEVLDSAEFVFLTQTGSYGNGTPLKLAAEEAGVRTCIYAFGDDIVLGENVSAGLKKTFAQTGLPVLAVQEVEQDRTSQFGIVECEKLGAVEYVKRLIEKPSAGRTPSRLASFGRYLVTPDLIEILRMTGPGKDNEKWFVDAVIQRLNKGQRVCAFPLTTGSWYTVGDPASYARAVLAAEAEMNQQVRALQPSAIVAAS